MGYPTKLLADGETIEFEMKPHWRALIVPAIWLIAVLFLSSWLGFVLADMQGSFAGFIKLGIVLGAVIILAIFSIRPFIYWLTTDYVFTNRRIILRSGFIAKHGRDMPLSKVQNVSFDVSVMGRILNYGRLSIVSASDEELVINDVPDVENIQREINRLHEEDDARRRGIGDGT